MLRENEHFRKIAELFNKYNATSKEIMDAGEILLSYLYKGKGTEDPDKLSYNMFYEKLAKSKSQVEPQMSLPTSDAAKWFTMFYSMRRKIVYNVDVIT